MILDEYETTDQAEMAYLRFCGFPFEYDRENPRKVKMIVKGDLRLIKQSAKDFWDNRGRYLDFLNAWKENKRSLWIGQEYDPTFKARKNKFYGNKNTTIRQSGQESGR